METKNWYSLSDAATLISLAIYPKEQDDARNEILRPRAVNDHLKALSTGVVLHYASLAPAPLDPLDRLLGGNEVGILKSNLIKYAGDIGLTLFVDAMPEPVVIKSENEQVPAPEAKKVKQDLSIRNNAIRQDAKNGLTNPQLQEKYGLSKTSISDICNEEKKNIGGSQNVMANVARRVIRG